MQFSAHFEAVIDRIYVSDYNVTPLGLSAAITVIVSTSETVFRGNCHLSELKI